MANDDNHQYFITIPNSNGETIIITPEILPEQLLPLVQKKQFKEEKIDLSNFTSAYKKIIENLAENGSNLSNIINVNSNNNSRIKQSSSNNENYKNHTNILSSTSSSIITSRSSLPTLLLRPPNLNQSNQNLQSSVFNDQSCIPGSLSDNSNNYITTLQLSQNNSTLAFSQPQTILHYSDQNDDSSNTLLIPISLHNSNQFSQQQILVAAAAVASGGYNQNCNDNSNINNITSDVSLRHNLNTTSLAKLISSNATNSLPVNVSNVIRSNSANSDISPSSRSSNPKRKSNLNSTDEFGRRKEMRLLKNREAARECRRKKKEYVKCLENRVTNLEQQNKVLVDEINRMKELYAKKSSKKLEKSETESKFVCTRTIDSFMKEDVSQNITKDREVVVNKDKLYECLPKLALTSMANISSMTMSSNINDSGYMAKDMLSHTNVQNIKDEANLFLANEKDVSKLSALLSNKSYKNINFSSNSTIFPEFHHEINPDDADNSNSSCD